MEAAVVEPGTHEKCCSNKTTGQADTARRVDNLV